MREFTLGEFIDFPNFYHTFPLTEYSVDFLVDREEFVRRLREQYAKIGPCPSPVSDLLALKDAPYLDAENFSNWMKLVFNVNVKCSDYGKHKIMIKDFHTIVEVQELLNCIVQSIRFDTKHIVLIDTMLNFPQMI